MRVQDTVPVIVVSMTKKKNRQQQHIQSENQDVQNNSESVDEREGSSNSSAPKHCVHINKSVSAGLQKQLKKIHLGQCSSCASSDAKSCVDDSVNAPEQPDIYLCLQCAFQGCDRTSPGHHALSHYQTAHSSPHDIAINLSTYAVWCYACDDFVSNDVSRKLKDWIDLLRRQNSTGTVKKSQQQQTVSSSLAADSTEKEVSAASNSGSGKQQMVSASAKQTQLVCSKVKGLANLGNTCFFNAVLQNLCQTHLLDLELREWTKKGQSVELVSMSNYDGDSESNCDDECDQPKKMECLTVRLADCGPLTQSVLSLFDEVTSTVTTKQRNYVSPSGLFNQVCHKAPRFKGYQQQDSHELLRYLLDGMKAEEIKRSQLAILKAFNLSENQSAKDLTEDKKIKIKEFGRSAKHTFVDRIFGGVFISTVVCQVCRVPTQMFEPFLDLSLPIADEKSAGQMGQAGKSLADVAVASVSSHHDTDTATVGKANDKQITKNQLKRQQKQSRKQKKQVTSKSSSSSQVDSSNVTNGPEMGADDETVEGESATAEEDVDTVHESTKMAEYHLIENADYERVNATYPVFVGNGDSDSPICNHNSNDKPVQADQVESSANVDQKCGEFTDSRNKVTTFEPAEVIDVICEKLRLLEGGIDLGVEVDTAKNSDAAHVEIVDISGMSLIGKCSGKHLGDRSTENDDGKGKKVADPIMAELPSLRSSTNEDGCEKMPNDQQPPVVVDNSCTVNSDALVDVADRSFDCFADKSFDARHGMFNGFHSPSPGGDVCCDEIIERSKQAEKTERRRRAMLAAMETAGLRQKPAGKECSLHCSLLQFTAVETLSGNNMLACSFCNSVKQKTNEATVSDVETNGAGTKPTTILTCANKQLLIYSAPAILTLHLKRFQQVGYNLRKNTQHVDFTELLDLAPYCSAFCEKTKRSASGHVQILYSLYGVIEHSGTLRSGHYTAYVKVRNAIPDARQFLHGLCFSRASVDDLVARMQSLGVDDSLSSGGSSCHIGASEGRWYHISDTSVSEVKSVDSVLNCQAYILFYERVA